MLLLLCHMNINLNRNFILIPKTIYRTSFSANASTNNAKLCVMILLLLLFPLPHHHFSQYEYEIDTAEQQTKRGESQTVHVYSFLCSWKPTREEEAWKSQNDDCSQSVIRRSATFPSSPYPNCKNERNEGCDHLHPCTSSLCTKWYTQQPKKWTQHIVSFCFEDADARCRIGCIIPSFSCKTLWRVYLRIIGCSANIYLLHTYVYYLTFMYE